MLSFQQASTCLKVMKRNTGSHVLNIVLTLFKRNDSDIRSTGLDVLFVPFLLIFRSSHQRCSVRKGVRRNFVKFTGKHLCQSLFFDKVANFIEIETLAQIFSCEFCEISKNTLFYRTPPVAAFGSSIKSIQHSTYQCYIFD